MKQNTFFKPEVQFFFPRLFDGKILYFLISHQNLQVCQLWERTAIISHHSMSKFKKNPQFSFIKFRALNKGVRFALPAHCSKPVLWYRQSKHMPSVLASSQVASQNFTNKYEEAHSNVSSYSSSVLLSFAAMNYISWWVSGTFGDVCYSVTKIVHSYNLTHHCLTK